MTNVSMTNAGPTPDTSKQRGPKTGVELHGHSAKEWRALSKEEREELKECRDTVSTKQKAGANGGGGATGKRAAK